jgi:hypothetical protein
MIKLVKSKYIIRLIKQKHTYGGGIECQLTNDIANSGVELGDSYTLFICNVETSSNSECLICQNNEKHISISIHNVVFVNYVSSAAYIKAAEGKKSHLRIIGNKKLIHF